MDQGNTTWIVAADAVEARVFVERDRLGPLLELPEMRMSATDAERHAGDRQTATVHARFGGARHGAGERNAAHLAEERFLARVADRLAAAAGRHEFDALVLMAPPHALGALRAALPAALAARVELTDAHERVGDGVDDLRRHLRDARAGLMCDLNPGLNASPDGAAREALLARPANRASESKGDKNEQQDFGQAARARR